MNHKVLEQPVDATGNAANLSEPFITSQIRRLTPVDARIGWIVPLIIFVFALHFTARNEPLELNIAWSAFAASVSCMVCVAATHYRIISLVTLVALWHMVVYPVAALLNLLQDVPSVRPDLWGSTDLAMWGCTVGCASLAGGALLAKVRPRKPGSARMAESVWITTAGANMVMFAFIVPAVALRVFTGVYDERFVGDGATLIAETSRYQNVLSYFLRLSQLGIFLQLFRYLYSMSRRDLVICLFMGVTFILALLPTGNRLMAYGFVPWLFVFYLSFETKRLRGVLVFLVLVVGFSFLSSVVQLYRETSQAEKSFFERIESMAKIATGEETAGDQERSSAKIMAGRLADYVSTGRIIDYSPNLVPFRGTQGLDDLWMVFVPKLIFSERSALGEQEIFTVEQQYKVHTGSQGGGSSPTMIIGDLYSRWGWPGVIIGMGLLGVVLAWITARFLSNWDIQTICFYALYVQTIPPGLTGSGLFSVIVLLTRELLICWFISKLLAKLLNRHSTGSYSKNLFGFAVAHDAPG